MHAFNQYWWHILLMTAQSFPFSHYISFFSGSQFTVRIRNFIYTLFTICHCHCHCHYHSIIIIHWQKWIFLSVSWVSHNSHCPALNCKRKEMQIFASTTTTTSLPTPYNTQSRQSSWQNIRNKKKKREIFSNIFHSHGADDTLALKKRGLYLKALHLSQNQPV